MRAQTRPSATTQHPADGTDAYAAARTHARTLRSRHTDVHTDKRARTLRNRHTDVHTDKHARTL